MHALVEVEDLPALFAAVKGHNADGEAALRRDLLCAGDEAAVPDVHAVKVAEQQHAGRAEGVSPVIDDAHHTSLTLARAAPPSTRAMP